MGKKGKVRDRQNTTKAVKEIAEKKRAARRLIWETINSQQDFENKIPELLRFCTKIQLQKTATGKGFNYIF